MTVSLLEIFAAARTHAAPLAAESAGYLLLAVADHVALSPRAVGADDVELSGDGSVRLRARSSAPSGLSPELAVRRLLARTLGLASSVGPALRRASERREEVGLDALVRELEVALIPVNRSAARRALSRLHRETERARGQGKLEQHLQSEAALVPTPAPLADALALGADFPEAVTPAPALPAVASAPPASAAEPVLAPPVASSPALLLSTPVPLPARASQPARSSAPPAPAPMLSPPPLPVAEELALTKPEPVVERARQRGSSTPRLGTLITAQTLPGEEGDLTERAPEAVMALDGEIDLELEIDVELEASAVTPSVQLVHAAAAPQPLIDPEPSRMPDVLTAMLALHVDAQAQADEAPTRLRDVVTELRVNETELPVNETELPVNETELPVNETELPVNETELPVNETELPVNETELRVNETELPELEVVTTAPSLEALALAPSPYAPAVLPERRSDVSELADSFYVSGGSEERELRGALKEMAGLELTPMPHPCVEDA